MRMERKRIMMIVSIFAVAAVLLSCTPSFVIRADDPITPPPIPTQPPDPTQPPETHSHTTREPEYELEVSCEEEYQKIGLDEIAKYTITLTNKGETNNVRIKYDRPSGWFGDISENGFTLGEGKIKEITIEIFPPASCKNGTYLTEVTVDSDAGTETLILETEVWYLGDITIKSFNYTVSNENVDFHVLLSNTGKKKELTLIFYIDDEELSRKELSVEKVKEAVFPWILESGEHTITITCVAHDENKENNSFTKSINFDEYEVSKSEPQMYRESAVSLMNKGEYLEAYHYYCLLDDEEEKEQCEKYIVANTYETNGKKLLETGEYTKAYSFLSEAIECYKELEDSEKVSEIEELLNSFSDKVHIGASSPETVVKTVVKEKNDNRALIAGLTAILLINILLILVFYKKKKS
ncbi:MAG: hypothetical protein U9N35_01445 [Euryarchaeota archaeon]|nr:hypothetical protein [Euryarchaeota archaeon]